MSFTLSTDTSCDIFRNELKARGISYRPLIYTIDDVPYYDEFTADEEYKEFYRLIRAGKLPTTSQINIAEHEEYFDSLLQKTDGDILHITLSSGLSNTYQSACTAAEVVNERCGKKRVYVVDSLGATAPQRMIVDEAERLRDAGVSAEEAVAALADYAMHVRVWFMPVDLMQLKRGGRVSGAAAVVGTALHIKPILTINKAGGLTVVQKKIGAGSGMKYMLEMFSRYNDERTATSAVYIPNADSPLAPELLAKVKEIRPDCNVQLGWVGPVIGAHTGEMAGVCFMSNSVKEI